MAGRSFLRLKNLSYWTWQCRIFVFLGRKYYNEKRTNLRSRDEYPLDTRPQSIERVFWEFFSTSFFSFVNILSRHAIPRSTSDRVCRNGTRVERGFIRSKRKKKAWNTATKYLHTLDTFTIHSNVVFIILQTYFINQFWISRFCRISAESHTSLLF